MPLEIEIKYRVCNHEAAAQALARMGFHQSKVVAEEDHYLNAADRDFAETGEAFRLRREGESYLLTYKGPKLPGGAKIRREIEVPVTQSPEDASRILDLLLALGFRSVATVTKERAFFSGYFQGSEVTVCLDSVDSLGSFVELEQLAEEHQAESVSLRLRELARALGLSRMESRSYLGLVLERCRGA